jgi:hypothetical protein
MPGGSTCFWRFVLLKWLSLQNKMGCGLCYQISMMYCTWGSVVNKWGCLVLIPSSVFYMNVFTLVISYLFMGLAWCLIDLKNNCGTRKLVRIPWIIKIYIYQWWIILIYIACHFNIYVCVTTNVSRVDIYMKR